MKYFKNNMGVSITYSWIPKINSYQEYWNTKKYKNTLLISSKEERKNIEKTMKMTLETGYKHWSVKGCVSTGEWVGYRKNTCNTIEV